MSVTWIRTVVVCRVCVLCLLHEAARSLSASYMSQVGGCVQGVCTLSVSWGGWRLYVSYMKQVDGCLQGVYSVIYLRQDDSYLLHEAEWRLSVSYMRQDGGFLQDVCTLSVTWGNTVIICQLHEAGWQLSAGCVLCHILETAWRLSVNCMRQDGGYLSVTWGRLVVVCMCVCTLSVTWGSMAIICQLHEVDWLLFAECVSVSWCWMAGICLLHEAGGWLSSGCVCVRCQILWGRLAIVCRDCVLCVLHEGTWRLSVSYMRRTSGLLLVTWGRKAVVCRVSVLSLLN